LAGLLITPLALFLIIAPDIVAYVAIHLRYDTTWYVISDRSMRIRRGIWAIHETTITFENVQNVAVNQGPLQRIFGIADVTVQTAGGGGGGQHEGASLASAHQGRVEGVSNAAEIRELILGRLTTSRTTGLGDEAESASGLMFKTGLGSPAQLALLREIRDAARRLEAIDR
jgi:uncharacterized membrane protein YdbT with pleckstrin-like domain